MSLSSALIIRGIARGVHVAGSLSVFGTVAARAILIPRSPGGCRSECDRRAVASLARLLRVSLVIAVTAGGVWLVAESTYITGSHQIRAGIAVLASVLRDTNFGHLLIARLALLALAAVIFGDGRQHGRVAIATGLAAIATVLQAGLGHGAAMGGPEGSALAVALALHVVAAGLWLGGLVPLLIIVATTPLGDAYLVARRFSRLGAICVATLTATAGLQGYLLIGSPGALVGTDYGRVAFAKLALFVVLLGIAAHNCFRLTPGLIGPSGERSRARLRRNIIGEALVGVCVIILAGVLLELPPGMDMGGVMR